EGWIGQELFAVLKKVFWFVVRIDEAKPANHLRLRVGQQRIRNMKTLSEFLKDLRVVVSHCCQSYFVLLKSCLGFLQLDQLLFAERSPICRTDKQKHQAISACQG